MSNVGLIVVGFISDVVLVTGAAIVSGNIDLIYVNNLTHELTEATSSARIHLVS